MGFFFFFFCRLGSFGFLGFLYFDERSISEYDVFIFDPSVAAI